MKIHLEYKQDGVYVYRVLFGEERLARTLKNISKRKKKKPSSILIRKET